MPALLAPATLSIGQAQPVCHIAQVMMMMMMMMMMIKISIVTLTNDPVNFLADLAGALQWFDRP